MSSWIIFMSFSARTLSGISPGDITVSAIIDEVYVNDEGVKDYDREDLSQLMPQVIKEFGSDRFNARLQDTSSP